MARTKKTPRRAELKAIQDIKYQQKQTKPAVPKIAIARYFFKNILAFVMGPFIRSCYTRYTQVICCNVWKKY